MGLVHGGTAALSALTEPVSCRWAWNLYHHWVGRAALLGAFANAMLGYALGQLPNWFYCGTAAIWAAIWLAAGAKMLANARHARRANGSLGGVSNRAEQGKGVASGGAKGAAAEP